jgi:hypothetical protein
VKREPEISPVPEIWKDGPIRYEQEVEDDPLADPEVPSIERQPESVEYDARSKEGFVVSGPLRSIAGDLIGRGRGFDTTHDAMTWARSRYPSAKLTLLNEGDEPRWAIRVTP